MYEDGWRIFTKDKWRYLECYYKDRRKVIHLWFQDGHYLSQVFGSDLEPIKVSNLLKDTELDALKFKSLLKAKELGWKVDIMDFN